MHSWILPLLLVLAVHADVTAQKTYDYIIVGGGTTGLVVANRLTEDLSSTLCPRHCFCQIISDNVHL